MKLGRKNPRVRNDHAAGSPHPGEPVFLTVGRLQRAHGLGGELVMEILTGFPERLAPGRMVYLGEAHTPRIIRSVRPFARGVLIAFDAVDTPELAREFRNQYVYVRSNDLPPLPEGEYYHHQLLGLAVVDQDGTVLGRLVEILETGANDVYIVAQADGSELLLPATAEVILAVDLSAGQIQVKPPEWL